MGKILYDVSAEQMHCSLFFILAASPKIEFLSEGKVEEIKTILHVSIFRG